MPVLYVTNEDAWHVVGKRLDALMRGRGLSKLPAEFGFAIHSGVWLDDPAWQARLIARVRAAGYRVVLLDPLRSLTACVDQGPRELQPLARYLRRLMDETGAVPGLSHHDTKPLQGQKETRQRPHRVSGGGIFSIADAPIHCERLGEDDPATSLIVPTLWKVCETPPALRVRLTWDADGARLTAQPLAARDAHHVALDEQLVGLLRQQTEMSTRALASAVHADRSTVASRLELLLETGQIDSRPGPRRATLWFLRGGPAA
jgi:hypothetical protein